jgi:hypothetical protein
MFQKQILISATQEIRQVFSRINLRESVWYNGQIKREIISHYEPDTRQGLGENNGRYRRTTKEKFREEAAWVKVRWLYYCW